MCYYFIIRSIVWFFFFFSLFLSFSLFTDGELGHRKRLRIWQTMEYCTVHVGCDLAAWIGCPEGVYLLVHSSLQSLFFRLQDMNSLCIHIEVSIISRLVLVRNMLYCLNNRKQDSSVSGCTKQMVHSFALQRKDS